MNGISPLVVTGIFLIAGFVVELLTVLRAPLGYQDETGFHRGVKIDPDDVLNPS